MSLTSSRISRTWHSIRGSLQGEQRDYTSGSLGKAITFLAIPMVLEMFMQAVFEVVDVFFVAKLGPDAVAGVGITGGLQTIVYAVAVGLGMAVTATVARRIGERDPEGASKAGGQSILLSLLISLPIMALGVIFPRELLQLMGASPEAVEASWGYCAVTIGLSAVTLLLFVLNAVFRGAGDAYIAMRILWLANGINILLDPILIFGLGPIPAFGATGAAVATVIGRGVGVALQLRILTRGSGRVAVHPRDLLRVDSRVLARLTRLSATGILQFLVSTASWLGMLRILAEFGSNVLAGYTIAIRIIIFTLLPSWGMGNAAATLVGQNLGAGKPDRAEKSVWVTGFSNMIFLGFVSLLFMIRPEPLIGIFTSQPEVIAIGADCLRYVSASYLFLAFGMVMIQSFNGAGDTWTPTWINFLGYWVVQIPLAYGLAIPMGMGAIGAFIAVTAAQGTLAVLAVAAFRRGRWKQQVV